jgi:tetratricopeptide (TPR) repeat protein
MCFLRLCQTSGKMRERLRRFLWFFTAILLVLAAFPLAAQTNFKRGEELFMENKSAEALPFFEAAVEEDSANTKASLYLAMTYLQLNRTDDAIAAYLKALPRAGDETSRIAYNLANIYYNKGDIETAIDYYSRAIDADPANASAYLNRANALVRSGAPGDALSDYECYLILEPRSEKREQVGQLTAFINEEFAEADRQRLLEEQRQIEAEDRARAEAERRQRILEEVSASLRAAEEEERELSAGTEAIP